MGFGFNFFIIFISLPLTIILFLLWAFTGKKKYTKIMFGSWGGIFLMVILLLFYKPLAKMKINKEDYYGNYFIDKNFFSKEQSDWQYKHFKFNISPSDSIFFYMKDGKDIIHEYKGTIQTVTVNNSERLKIIMEQPTHPILQSDPKVIRQVESFYLVFHSPVYHNMFFRKK